MKEKSDEGDEGEDSDGKQERYAFDEGHAGNVGAEENERGNHLDKEDNSERNLLEAGEEEESELDLRNYLRDDILESVREKG